MRNDYEAPSLDIIIFCNGDMLHNSSGVELPDDDMGFIKGGLRL